MKSLSYTSYTLFNINYYIITKNCLKIKARLHDVPPRSSTIELSYIRASRLLDKKYWWLGGRDSNPDTQDQNLVSYH